LRRKALYGMPLLVKIDPGFLYHYGKWENRHWLISINYLAEKE
jgi:hypothetical protein